MVNPLTSIDFYKADHRSQYPVGTTEVYANFTPRSNKYTGGIYGNEVVFFGLQYFIKEFLTDQWENFFFGQNKDEVVSAYKRRLDNSLGKDAVSVEHIAALHDLGYLPIRIKALPEGASVPIGVPVLTIVNTHPDFFWLTNYLETILSCYLWKPITSATIARAYRKKLETFAIRTGSPLDFVNFQAHDFSYRGLSSPQSAAISGAAHLTSFWGTDTVTAIDLLEDYYGADSDNEPVGFSVPATEHSVMCMGTQESEVETFDRLITSVYPKGIVSIVSDTWDFWKVLTEYLPALKDKIMKRDGKVVIRPDSGDPVDIICGNHNATPGTPEYKGAVRVLWDLFGGTLTSSGHCLLDPHIGLIYGDSITIGRANEILQRLDHQKFASANVVFGVGSFTYQYVTRDTFGFAVKATHGVVNGEDREIFKCPKTDDGGKKSAVGLLRVAKENGQYRLYDRQTRAEEAEGELRTVFEDGKSVGEHTLEEIRQRIKGERP